jgi:hypothetical protein
MMRFAHANRPTGMGALCLLHELAHVGRHMDKGEGDAFVDDLTMRGIEGVRAELER